ncbi:transporter [Bacteroidota bacterium]
MKKVLIIVLLIPVWLNSKAQTDEQLLPAQLKQQTVITEPVTVRKGYTRLGFAAYYSVIDRWFDEDGKREYFPENTWASLWNFLLLAQYGITDRLQLGIDIPFRSSSLYQSIILDAPGADYYEELFWKVKGSGLGDISIGAKYQIITETPSRPSLVFTTYVTLPTGQKNPTDIEDERNYKLPAGSGETTLDVDLLLRKINFPYSYTFNIGYLHSFGGSRLLDPMDTEETEYQSGGNLDIGASYNFNLNEWIVLQNELMYFRSAPDKIAGAIPEDEFSSWSVQYLPKINFQLKRLRIVQAVGILLVGRNTGADPTYFIVAQYML